MEKPKSETNRSPKAASAKTAPAKSASAPRKAAPAKPAVEQVADTVKVSEAVETVRDAALAAEESVVEIAGQMHEFMEKNMTKLNNVTDFAKGNMEAMIKSAKAAAKGAETIATQYVEASKKSAEEMRAALKTFTSAKTPNEFIQAHNEYAKARIDRAVANFSEASETWMKVARDVTEPLSARVSDAMDAVKKKVA